MVSRFLFVVFAPFLLVKRVYSVIITISTLFQHQRVYKNYDNVFSIMVL